MKKIVFGIFKLIKILIKLIFILIIGFFVVSFMMVGIDYVQMKNGNLPVFCISQYNEESKIQVFRSFFYTASRTVRASSSESLYDSSNIQFKSVFGKKKIEYSYQDVKDFTIETSLTSDCKDSAKLYYASLKVKVYTYCLDDISVYKNSHKDTLYAFLEKDNSIVEDIKDQLSYKGLLSDKSTSEFVSLDEDFASQGLKIYHCNKTNINDVYIGPKDMSFHNDFCTYKDDDFKFIYELLDETPSSLQPVLNEENEVVPEAFYEDSINRYEFTLPKSQYVFITTPEVRGKAATKVGIKEALSTGKVTIDEVKEKGLQFQVINKEEERERLEKEKLEKERIEREKQEAEQAKNEQ